MESELVWLEWKYDMLKIFIDGLEDVNAAYEQAQNLYRADPSYADLVRRMETNYSEKNGITVNRFEISEHESIGKQHVSILSVQKTAVMRLCTFRTGITLFRRLKNIFEQLFLPF